MSMVEKFYDWVDSKGWSFRDIDDHEKLVLAFDPDAKVSGGVRHICWDDEPCNCCSFYDWRTRAMFSDGSRVSFNYKGEID